MRASRPKPLHRVCGRPMVLHVLDAVAELDLDRAVVVVGHGAERVTKALLEQAPPGLSIDFVEQRVQRAPGDTPLLRPATLAAWVRSHRATDAAASVLTAMVSDATGYGRVVRNKADR